MLHYLRLMLQLVMAPTHGWEDVAADETITARKALMSGLLPLAVVASLCVFSAMLCEHHPSVWKLTLQALMTFAEIMLTYFIGMAIMMATLPHISYAKKISEERVGLYLNFAVGMMAVITLVENLTPASLPIFRLLPAFVLAVMGLGRNYLSIDEDNTFKHLLVIALAVLVPFYLLREIFSLFY